MRFSVLMSLYWREHPSYLYESLNSVFSQTLVPDEVVLVEDGPLTPELDSMVREFQEKYPALKLVKIPVNSGLGNALNEGIKYCTCNIVARMDTDDICKPDRFEKQIGFMESHPDVHVLSSGILEFIDTVENITAVKKLPETHNEILCYSRKRCPVNHPSAVFRKHSVIECGGYGPFPEDYYLWAKMIMKGYKFHNLQEPLLFFRSSNDVYKRRGGWNYFIAMSKLQVFLYKIKFLPIGTFLYNFIIRGVVSLAPNVVRKAIYTKFLR